VNDANTRFQTPRRKNILRGVSFSMRVTLYCMKFPLSKDARVLLVRVFLIVMAAGSLYGVYDNQEFLARFPFYLSAAADVLFAGIFLYFAYFLPTFITRTNRKILMVALAAFWVYTTAVSLSSSALYAFNLGIFYVALEAGKSIPVYIASEVIYLAILPALVFGFVIWLVRKV